MDLWQLLWTYPVQMGSFALLVGVVVVGVFIALDDRITNPITSQDNLGWVLVIGGLLAFVGLFIIPFWPALVQGLSVMWAGGTTTMFIALIGGLVAITIGIIVLIVRRH
jgi:hypothetical protein